MEDISYEIVETLGTLSTSRSGWTKEVNMISWNGGQARLDIRSWSPGEHKPGKGVSLNQYEEEALKKILAEGE